MAKVRFSRQAEADLDDIATYTVRTWDADQADRYLTLLEDYCQRLADSPVLGRACDHIGPVCCVPSRPARSFSSVAS